MSDPKYSHIGRPEVRVIEECSELIMALCKIERFGRLNWHPDDRSKLPNLRRAMLEIKDVREALDSLEAHLKGMEKMP